MGIFFLIKNSKDILLYNEKKYNVFFIYLFES